MTSGVPSHGPWCATRTFGTKCPDCDAAVFYFTCNHGSRVFFDALGWPWPEHRHRWQSFEQQRDSALRAIGKRATERYLAQQMMIGTVDNRYGRRIARAYRETAERSGTPHRAPRETLREDPYAGVKTVEVGVVRALILEVDVYAKLGTPATNIAAAALGELGAGAYAQVTVHTGALGERDDYSYTFFVGR